MTPELMPYIEALKPLQGCHFAGAVTDEGWSELARALKESSKSIDHARSIIDRFMRTERYGRDGELITSVPAAIELRAFARTVPEKGTEAFPADTGCSCVDGFVVVTRGEYEFLEPCKRCVRGAWRERQRCQVLIPETERPAKGWQQIGSAE